MKNVNTENCHPEFEAHLLFQDLGSLMNADRSRNQFGTTVVVFIHKKQVV